MKAYTVHYRMYLAADTKSISFLAKNKEDAYDKAMYEIIPDIEHASPYEVYVYSVTYQNGNQKIFNR